MKRRNFLKLSFGLPAAGVALAKGGAWARPSAIEVPDDADVAVPELVGEQTFKVFLMGDPVGAQFGPIPVRTYPENQGEAVVFHPFGDLTIDQGEIMRSGIRHLRRIDVDIGENFGLPFPRRVKVWETSHGLMMGRGDTLTLAFDGRGIIHLS